MRKYGASPCITEFGGWVGFFIFLKHFVIIISSPHLEVAWGDHQHAVRPSLPRHQLGHLYGVRGRLAAGPGHHQLARARKLLNLFFWKKYMDYIEMSRKINWKVSNLFDELHPLLLGEEAVLAVGPLDQEAGDLGPVQLVHVLLQLVPGDALVL